tara:strand:- start:149 stop:379 length:231 start_codon:yes stop_codon:yes gene_type:complete
MSNLKKVFLSSLSVLFLLVTLSFTLNDGTSTLVGTTPEVETVACKIRQCNATAKSTGNRCKHCVSDQADYKCWQHK